MYCYVYVPQAETHREATEDDVLPNPVSSAQATTSKVSGGQCGFKFCIISNKFYSITSCLCYMQSQPGQEALQEGSRPQPLSTSVVVAVSAALSGVVLKPQ
jgi:hypothetical protein